MYFFTVCFPHWRDKNRIHCVLMLHEKETGKKVRTTHIDVTGNVCISKTEKNLHITVSVPTNGAQIFLYNLISSRRWEGSFDLAILFQRILSLYNNLSQ